MKESLNRGFAIAIAVAVANARRSMDPEGRRALERLRAAADGDARAFDAMTVRARGRWTTPRARW